MTLPSVDEILATGVYKDPNWLKSLESQARQDPAQFHKLIGDVTNRLKVVGQQQQLQLYQPAGPRNVKIHLATNKHVIAVGGNRSGKTETNLVDAIICMTGIIPWSLEDIYPREKICCPGRYRIVLESLTNTWGPVVRPKLQWDHWSGRGKPGSPTGHWGWVPRNFLKSGKWEDSWSEKERTLTLTCGCTLQICSYDQDPGDQAGSSLHRIIFDEPPDYGMYRENLMRTLDTGGQIYFGFTPPDDPGKAMRGSWIYELYEKGQDGPGKDPTIQSIELYTEENRVLDPQSLAEVTAGLTPSQRETRLHGAFMHLSGRIYPDFTDVNRDWCFSCNQAVFSKENRCLNCQSTTTTYNNVVEPNELVYKYPVIFLLDPHPRKPNMMLWVAIDAMDDWWAIKEMEVDGDPVLVAKSVNDFERVHNISVVQRLVDPNMAESAAHNAGRRQVTVRDEFDAVGLRCALANDAFDVGMKRLRELIRPDQRTRAPRLHVFNTLPRTIKQFKTYVWSEWSGQSEAVKDPKATPIDKEDDFPTMCRYLANAHPTFAGLRQGVRPMQATAKKRRGAYA